jgi:hypothetical protein
VDHANIAKYQGSHTAVAEEGEASDETGDGDSISKELGLDGVDGCDEQGRRHEGRNEGRDGTGRN